jgi:hypothetical protein
MTPSPQTPTPGVDVARVVDIDALVNPARVPQAKVAGRMIPVLPLTGRAAHRVAISQQSGSDADAMGALLDAVRASCPALTEAELDALSIDQVVALVALARDGMDAVDRMLEERQRGT